MEELLSSWIAAGRRSEAEPDGAGGWLLRETRRAFVVPCVFVGIGAFFVALGLVVPTAKDRWILSGLGGGAILATLAWSLELRRTWLRVGEDGLSQRRLLDWARPRRVPWAGMQVAVSPLNVVFTAPTGARIKLPRMATFDGLGTLLEAMSVHLPAHRGSMIEAAHALGVPLPVVEDPAADWLEGVPRLYPGLSGVALGSFLTVEAAKRLAALPTVFVHPFVDSAGDASSQHVGVAVSRMVLRDLMLLRELSVRGPEDTPDFSLAALEAGERPARPSDVLVAGRARLDGDRLRVDLLVRRGDASTTLSVEDAATTAHVACATEVARSLGLAVDDKTQRRWRALRPRSVETLVRHGALVLGGGDASFDDDPAYPTLLHDLDADRATLMRALEKDPFDAQLCFRAFLGVWRGDSAQDCALQLARKAIELSPGHGKAHMVLPHVARDPLTLLHHSELGYRLLPGNVFAVTNYLNYLCEAGRRGGEVLPLAEEAVRLDPADPSARGHAIDALRDLGDFRGALAHAQELVRLYGPPMNARTRHCLEQSPTMAEALRNGALDLPKSARALVAEFERGLIAQR